MLTRIPQVPARFTSLLYPASADQTPAWAHVGLFRFGQVRQGVDQVWAVLDHVQSFMKIPAGAVAIEMPESRARIRTLVASMRQRSTMTACPQGVASL